MCEMCIKRVDNGGPCGAGISEADRDKMEQENGCDMAEAHIDEGRGQIYQANGTIKRNGPGGKFAFAPTSRWVKVKV